MTIGMILLSLLMFTIVGWLWRQSIGVQPWDAEATVRDLSARVAGRPAAKTALWVFLAVASSLFVLFVSAYAMRLTIVDWTPLPRPRLLMVNTALLIAASACMAWTSRAARRDDFANARRGLLAAALLTLAFLAGQLYVWAQMRSVGIAFASSAAAAFFYLLTAVHGIHVLGGLVAWTRTAGRAWRASEPARARLSVQLCATYWHFLLVVWLVLYALLVSDRMGLAICSQGAL